MFVYRDGRPRLFWPQVLRDAADGELSMRVRTFKV